MTGERYCWCGNKVENDHPSSKYCNLHCAGGYKYWETAINNKKKVFNRWLKNNGNGSKLEFEDTRILVRMRTKLKKIKKENEDLYDRLMYRMYNEEGERFVKMVTEDMSYFREMK